MRNLVLCTILISIIILTGITVYSIEGKTTRQNELDANLSSVMERTMEIMTVDPTYTINGETNEYMIADFMQNFLIRMNSNSEYKIDILGADAEKGMLSVRVTETYPSLFSKSSVSATRTIVLDDSYNSGENYYSVSFYNDYEDGTYKNPIKNVYVLGNSTLQNLCPVEPVKEGYNFKGWELLEYDELNDVYVTLDYFTVTKDLKFVASWKKDADDIYTISFYANNQLYDSKKVIAGYPIGGHEDAPVKEDYTFKGWSSKQGEYLTDEEVKNKIADEHMKFIAVYEKNQTP